ncbi:hypothetical protein L917_03478 [Phytophthora nicotianae]|uniref:CCHC-type domain-containing protein n=1 Tax=Phytophthora nicotianae TaxID=4792 RepID=W2LST1_PHYNI|nr:hypothetical protein L917_03478 [Phytophthora nicotianae]
MDPGEHFVPAQALVEGLTAAMGQLADHLMQQNHQFQSSLLEQLNAQRPVPEFKVEGTRMPTFSGLLEESVDEFIFGAKLFMQGSGLHQCGQQQSCDGNARVEFAWWSRVVLPSRKNSSRQTSSIVSKPPSDSVGKSGETRQEVSYLRCQTLGAAISHAQSYERAHFTGNNVSSDQAGRPAATASPEPMDISAMDSRRISKEACCQHRLCLYCKAPGHRIRDYPKKP